MQAFKSLLVALCVIGLTFAEQVPVFMWGANSEAKPSLTTLHEKEFAELVTPLLTDKTLIVFLEKGLTNKDFLCSNAVDGKSCFARLRDVGSKTFYASVKNPVEALRSVVGSESEYNSVDATGKFAKPLEVSKSKIIFVNFDDEAQSNARDTILELHDSAIAGVTSQFGDNVFYMYTSVPFTAPVSKSLERQRRSAAFNAASAEGNIIRSGANFLLYYTTLSVIKGKEVTPIKLENSDVVVTNATALSVKLQGAGSVSISFDVTLDGGYFFMNNFVYNNIKFYSNEVYAPTDFSYFCGNLTLNSVVNVDQPTSYAIKWNSFQFQAPFGSTKDENFVFGDPWHCVGFFTGSILSGLLIVVLLLTITFIGVCWMMDINTMDRFDDPKGKTITINASD